jgi:hypothetical protein
MAVGNEDQEGAYIANANTFVQDGSVSSNHNRYTFWYTRLSLKQSSAHLSFIQIVCCRDLILTLSPLWCCRNTYASEFEAFDICATSVTPEVCDSISIQAGSFKYSYFALTWGDKFMEYAQGHDYFGLRTRVCMYGGFATDAGGDVIFDKDMAHTLSRLKSDFGRVQVPITHASATSADGTDRLTFKFGKAGASGDATGLDTTPLDEVSSQDSLFLNTPSTIDPVMVTASPADDAVSPRPYPPQLLPSLLQECMVLNYLFPIEALGTAGKYITYDGMVVDENSPPVMSRGTPPPSPSAFQVYLGASMAAVNMTALTTVDRMAVLESLAESIQSVLCISTLHFHRRPQS